MKKQVLFEKQATDKLITGVNILADAVKTTLGGAGRTVIIEDPYGNPQVTKDGVTVAKSIFLKDPVENMGALILKQAASKTATEAGDGTTTSTVLAQSLVNKGKELVENNHIPSEIKKGMDLAVSDVVEYLKSVSVEVKDDTLRNVAIISANGDEELGTLIADAFIRVGKNGVVTMDESKNSETYVDYSEGMEIFRGYLSRHYVTDNKKDQCVLNEPLVLLSDVKINRIEQIMHMVNYALENNKELFIVADMEDNLYNTFTVNKMNGMPVCVIKPPMFGVKRKELLEDMAILSGGKLISEETGDDLTNVDFTFFGNLQKVTVGKSKTTMITESKSRELLDRIGFLKERLGEEDVEEAREFLRERIAKLDGGVGIIFVGAASDVEMKEKKDRVDDAISATKAALEEGIISGGGISLFDASFKIESDENLSTDQKVGYNLVKECCKQPLAQIIDNSGKVSEDVVFNIWSEGDYGYGYDVKNDEYGDMMSLGIIDPLKVTRNAIENAVSVASTILSTDCTVTNIKE